MVVTTFKQQEHRGENKTKDLKAYVCILCACGSGTTPHAPWHLRGQAEERTTRVKYGAAQQEQSAKCCGCREAGAG